MSSSPIGGRPKARVSRHGPGSAPSPVGVVLSGPPFEPERVGELARRAETLGFDELWLHEDYFFHGAMASAAMALAQTQRIRVGLGIVSALVRHPAVLAMELSTLARSFPGRLIPGIGVGADLWLQQMGLRPASALAAMRECLTAVRRLLDGEAVSLDGSVFHLDQIQLEYPSPGLELHVGATGPKMLALSGDLADGTILSTTSGPSYVAWAAGQLAAARGPAVARQPLRCLAIFSVDHEADKARAAVSPMVAWVLALEGPTPHTEAFGNSAQLSKLLDGDRDPDRLLAMMPNSWIEEFAIAGDPGQCVTGIDRLLEAGADSVILRPVPAERAEEMLELTASEILPKVNARPTQARRRS